MPSAAHWSLGLNTAQHEGVACDTGPVAVLAGPGTGKTRVITHRIARLIQRDGVRPESIAAVTFTVKAAEEMQSRLADLIGSPAAQVRVGTFHSLGRRILLRWGDTIGVAAQAELMDSVQRDRMLREACRGAIDEGRIGVAQLADGGVDAVCASAWAWIEKLRTDAVDPDESMKLARRWDALIEKRGPEGDWDDERVGAERVRAEELSAASAVYARFEAIRLERGLLSFDDFILLPIRVLRESMRARAVVLDEVRHLVVDEFQDVNGAQLALLRELSPPEMGRDICVVGDDDQAIYGFRGSDDRAFQHFSEIWTDAVRVTLTENYRSSQAVLRAAAEVIGLAHDRFEPGKEIHARREFAESVPDRVEAVEVEGRADEGTTIAAMILADRAEHPERELSRIAVIGRSHGTLGEIGRALEIEGIPVDASGLRDAQEDEAVVDVRAWIAAVVGAPGLWLMRLLVRPPVSMEDRAASALLESHAAHVRQAGVEGEEALGFEAWCAERGEPTAALERFAALLGELRGLSAHTGAQEMVLEIIQRTGVAHRALPDRRSEARRVSALAGLLRSVRALQARIDPPGDLASYHRYVEALDERERIEGLPDFERINGRDEAGSAGGGGVRLLTAHASKGLEFDTVYVPRIGAAAGCFGQVVTNDGPALPDELLALSGDRRSAKEREQDEVRRLFYVACTRAERRLVLLSKKAKARSTSMHFFQELAWRGKAPLGPDDRDASAVLLDGAAVVRACTRSGIVLRGGDALGAEGAPREARSRVLGDARRTARRAAAAALDRAEEGLAGEGELGAIAGELRDSARRLAIVRAFEAGVEVPAWLGGADGFATELGEQLRDAREDGARGVIGQGMTPPLKLSYSMIDQYRRCPACFYVKYVLGLSEPGTSQQIVGTVTHAALEAFYRRWSEADAEGAGLPGLEDLLALARDLFVAESRRVKGVDRAQLEQVLAQLRLGFASLHDPGAEVMMLEEHAPFFYARPGIDERAHSFSAKIDRVDRVGDGFRIVDYKTGGAWDTLRQPKADDLQMGVYSMALGERLGMGVGELRGTAEYWLFATGERGVLRLEEIDHAKVRSAIDKAIAGMLAGEFGAKKECKGECGLLMGTGD